MTGAAPAVSFVGAERRYRTRRGEVVALDRLDVEIAGGGVHGLVGPNGSGKSTALRALVGHVRLDAGHASLLGRGAAAPPRHVALRRTGVLLDRPRFHGRLRARTILDLHRRLLGAAPARIDTVVHQVGLGDRVDDRVGTYSLGMRQRLALGLALMGDPELLLLDEPSNGLDPSGMEQLRRLLRRLGDDGRTVVLSSHLLADLQSVCESVTVVVRGRAVFSGPVAALPGSLEESFAAVVRSTDPSRGEWGAS